MERMFSQTNVFGVFNEKRNYNPHVIFYYNILFDH